MSAQDVTTLKVINSTTLTENDKLNLAWWLSVEMKISIENAMLYLDSQSSIQVRTDSTSKFPFPL